MADPAEYGGYPYSLVGPILQVKDACLKLGEKQVLEHLSFTVQDVRRPGHQQGQIIALLGPSGVGKCLAKGTRVLMFDGTVRHVEDVQVGDLLMGPDSKHRRVLTLGNGHAPLYDVIPVKGEPFRVNGPHILSIVRTDNDWIVELSVNEYMTRNNTFKGTVKCYRTGVDFPAKAVPIDPYFLGLWLGDGENSSPAITSADIEILNYVKNLANKEGVEFTEYDKKGDCPRFRIHDGWQREDSLLFRMRELKLFHNKHIPLVYKANSRGSRLRVLAGLLDSDGHLIQNCYDFISKYEVLSDDVCYLARSLGLAAYKTACRKGCQTGAVGTYYRVCISGNTDEIPVLLPRKKATRRKQRKNVLRTGFTVREAGVGEYFGFQLDGDGLFLLGDFTVTHNSQLFRRIAGLDALDSGEILVGLKAEPTQAGKVGVVMQHYPLLMHRSVLGNLLVAGRQAGLDTKAATEKAKGLLETFSLYDRADAWPAELSGGMRQRVAIAQQLMCSEHLLLMDEPFSGLDPAMKEKACDLLEHVAGLHEENTLVVVTHDVRSAVRIADHVWLLGRDRNEKGEVVSGAKVQLDIDLKERGIAWRPNPEQMPMFDATVREIEERFKTL